MSPAKKYKEFADERIDAYWHRIFERQNDINECKYPQISLVVKNVLALSHGNADVERGFSVSLKILTEDKRKGRKNFERKIIYSQWTEKI